MCIAGGVGAFITAYSPAHTEFERKLRAAIAEDDKQAKEELIGRMHEKVMDYTHSRQKRVLWRATLAVARSPGASPPVVHAPVALLYTGRIRVPSCR